MTSRGMALHLCSHILVHTRRPTLNAMAREDEKRFNEENIFTDKDALMVVAHKKEAFVLEFESEMRAAILPAWSTYLECSARNNRSAIPSFQFIP